MSINKENKLTDWLPFVGNAVQQMNAAFPTLTWGTYGGHHPHKNRASDGMVPAYKTAAGKALGWACAKWVWANRKRLDVWYVIFDAKIISETYPNAGWRTYTPDAAAVKRSRDSAYHYNHVHVSFNASGTIEGLAPVDLVPNLPTYYVDPAEVETFLWGVKHSTGEAVKQREPGFPITTGVGFVTVDGGKWLLTEAGYRYHTDYLTTTRPATGGGTPEPEPVLPTYTVKAGDTLTRIAAKYGLTDWNVVADVNPGIDPNKVRVGQVLRLPSGSVEVVTPPAPKPEPKPEEPKPMSATATIFGLNILRRTDTLAGRKRWPARKPLLQKLLRDVDASVYLLIETDKTTRADMGAGLGDGFTWWGFKYYGIYWDQSVWERVGDATNQVEYRDNENRFLLSLPLRHKATGKVITFDCTHLENDGGGPGDWGHQKRAVEATHLAQLASKGNRVGFFDCNSTTPAIIAHPTARQKQKPRPILAKAGARFVSSLGSKVKNIEYGSHHGGKSGVKGPLIDDAWVMGDVSIASAEIVRTDGTDATDHNGIKFTIKF